MSAIFSKKLHLEYGIAKYVRLNLFSLLCVLCPLFLILLLSACATTSNKEDTITAEARFKLGVSYISKGELTEASIEFQKALKLNRKHKESLHALGFISTRFGKYDEAISYYKQAISIAPDYSEAMNSLGVAYMETEKPDEAVNYFNMALNNPFYTTPEKPYSNIGLVYYRKGDYQGAEEAVKKALVRNPNSPVAIYIQGLLYLKQGDDEAAMKKFTKALTIEPDYLDARWELANVYVRAGEQNKAIEHFKLIAERAENTAIGKEALEYIKLLEK
ncbi:MAG: tetratricopeptide repeat protein [Nitrospirae bacterium]|nr:tetratricopeptide repeat protein [Nitrospirota bacterium]